MPVMLTDSRMPTPILGVLVAFEGIDGSGKTTQTAKLKAWGEGLGLEVVSTKEPTAGTWGKKIRDSKFTARMSPQDELDCFVNDRKEHVATVLMPALKRGALVLVDRYYYSTVAYQGARGLDPRGVLKLNRGFAPIPDLVFLMDLDPKAGLERIHTRGEGQDLFETVGELTKARATFLDLAKTDRHLVVVDAQQNVEAVHRKVVSTLVCGPIADRLRERTTAGLAAPEGKPEYELLKLAIELSRDASMPVPEQHRRLWVAAQS